MIEILEEARQRSMEEPRGSIQAANFTSNQQVAIAMQLIKADMIEADTGHSSAAPLGCHIYIYGISLSGRRYLEELKLRRDAKRWPTRLKRGGLVFVGWLSRQVTANWE